MIRYQVVTWSSDIGSDEKMDFATFAEAKKEANRYRKTEEYAAIYDYVTKTARVIFGTPYTDVFADWVKVLA